MPKAKPRSAVGRPLTELPQVLAPLEDALRTIDFKAADPRQRFVCFQMLDTRRAVLAIMALVDARRNGWDVDAAAIEVMARRVVEMAIIAAYSVKEPRVAERFLKKEDQSWERSFGRRAPTGYVSNAKALPDYREMAKAADPGLVEVWDRLSHTSHPRQASPYSMVEMGLSITADQFFELRGMPAVDDLDVAIAHIVEAWKTISSSGV